LAAESLLDPGLAAVLRRRQFWALGMAILLGGGSIAAFVVHLIPMMSSLGGSRQLAVRLSSEMGLAIIAGRLITGILLDRFAVRFIGSVYFLLGSLALLALASGPSLSTLHVSVVILGLGSGAEVDLVAFAASRYFGLGHFGEICAWLFAFFAVGFGLAPAGAGALFDHFGNYHAALWIGSGCLLAASGLFSTLGRTPRMA
jgi:MFS family permease